eukprot:jgi/Galph1/2461/GphlegSOOS_G1089.1
MIQTKDVLPPFLPLIERLWQQSFQPNQIEKAVYEWWESNGFFRPESTPSSTPFSISMPPPNITGALHMGHAMFSTIQDMLIRYYRMNQYKTCWIPGTDHASIATQMLIERSLREQGTSKEEIGRESFLQLAWQWKEEKVQYINQQLRALGASCDWSRERFTMDETLCRAVEEAFIRLYERGYIYRGYYLVNWSPQLQTAVSDLEVEMVEEDGFLYYIKYYSVDNKIDFISVATSRLETIFGDVAIAVHPLDERYNNWIGKQVMVPFVGRKIPVIGDDSVDPTFGTGALKITPAHDHQDYAIGTKHSLEFINMMNLDGTINQEGGIFEGVDRMECRQQLWKWMESNGLSLKKEPYRIRVPRSQRSGEVIEPLLSFQWFLRTSSLALAAIRAVKEGIIRLIPSRMEKDYLRWMENIHDWCISRQLWWGHRIPVWYVVMDNESSSWKTEEYIVAHSEEEAYAIAKEKYPKAVSLKRETDVLDTWFSSGLWPFAILGWPNIQAIDYQTFYPNQVMETGYDILFFWVARMIMLGYELTGKPPFHTVYLHGLVRDAKGQKMSKTLGNVLDPLQISKEYGTDALRFAIMTKCIPGQDISLSLEHIAGNRNFANKLWNIGRYIVQNLTQRFDKYELSTYYNEWMKEPSLSFEWEEEKDKKHYKQVTAEPFILYQLQQTITQVTKDCQNYSLESAANRLVHFLWDDLADWYIEISKTRWNDSVLSKKQVAVVLLYVWDQSLRLLHPFMPFITEALWQWLKYCCLTTDKQALIIADWPRQVMDPIQDDVSSKHNNNHFVEHSPVLNDKIPDEVGYFETFRDIVRAIRQIRADYGIKPSDKVQATIFIGQEPHSSLLVDALITESKALQALAKTTEQLEIRQDASIFKTDGNDKMLEKGTLYRDGCIYVLVSTNVLVSVTLKGWIDTQKEIHRLEKQEARLRKEMQDMQSRLNNPLFLEKAPSQVIDETSASFEQCQQQWKTVQQHLSIVQTIAKE